jgi:hypothetical protein
MIKTFYDSKFELFFSDVLEMVATSVFVVIHSNAITELLIFIKYFCKGLSNSNHREFSKNP